MNTRTSKRYRDNRPSEEAVQSETIRKLFLAQKDHLDERTEVPVPVTVIGGREGLDEDMYGDGAGDMEFDGDTMVDGDLAPATSLELGKVEANQRSIHDFFGGRKPETVPHQAPEEVKVVERGDGDGMEVDNNPMPYMDTTETKGMTLAAWLTWDPPAGRQVQWHSAPAPQLPVDFNRAGDLH